MNKFMRHEFVQREMKRPEAVFGDSGREVKRLQEWLSFAGQKIVIDGAFGKATLRALRTVTKNPEAVEISTGDWVIATQFIRFLLDKDCRFPSPLTVARAMYMNKVRELGGNNKGPWVRMFMRGREGTEYPWCAGFVSTVIEIYNGSPLGAKVKDLSYTWSSSEMFSFAKTAGKLITVDEMAERGIKQCVFLVRGGGTGHKHAGFAHHFDFKEGTFETIEGNSNSQASFDGDAVTCGIRSVGGKDFIYLGPGGEL